MTEKERGIQQTFTFVVFLGEQDLSSMFIDDANNIFMVSNALEQLHPQFHETQLRGALMFIVSLTSKLLGCKVWKLDPLGALPFITRIYNCLSMGFPIQSEYYVIRKTH